MTQTNTALRNRIMNGMGAQGFGQVVQVLIRLCEVPLFLSFWGANGYGEWLMIAALPAYLALSDAGFTQTSCRDITMRTSAGDRQGALSVYQSSWSLLLILSLFIGCVAVLVSIFVPLNQLLGFTSLTRRETSIVFVILAIHILLGFQGGLLTAAFWASGKYPKGMFLTSLTQLIEFCAMALGVMLGGSPVHASACFLLGRVVGTGITWAVQRNTAPWLFFGFQHASLYEVRRLLLPSFTSLAFPLGVALNTQGLRLVIGLVLGPTAVAIFAPLRTLSNFVLQPQAVIYRLTEPEISTAYGLGKSDLFLSLYCKASQYTAWALFFGCLTAIPVANWILPVWTSRNVTMDWPTFLFLLADVFIYGIWGIVSLPLRAVNQHNRLAAIFIVAYGPILIGLSFFAANVLGISGVALILLLVDLVILFYAMHFSNTLTAMRWRIWLRFVVTPPTKELGSLMSGIEFVFLGRGRH